MEIEGGKGEQEDGGSGCDADDNLAKGDEDDDAKVKRIYLGIRGISLF